MPLTRRCVWSSEVSKTDEASSARMRSPQVGIGEGTPSLGDAIALPSVRRSWGGLAQRAGALNPGS